MEDSSKPAVSEQGDKSESRISSDRPAQIAKADDDRTPVASAQGDKSESKASSEQPMQSAKADSAQKSDAKTTDEKTKQDDEKAKQDDSKKSATAAPAQQVAKSNDKPINYCN